MMGWGYAGGRWAERERGEIVCSILDNDILVKEPTSGPMSLSTAERVGIQYRNSYSLFSSAALARNAKYENFHA